MNTALYVYFFFLVSGKQDYGICVAENQELAQQMVHHIFGCSYEPVARITSKEIEEKVLEKTGQVRGYYSDLSSAYISTKIERTPFIPYKLRSEKISYFLD